MSNEHGRRHRSLCSNDVVRFQASSPVRNLMVHLSVITWRLWLCDEWRCDSSAIPTRLLPRTLQHYRPSLSCFSFWPLVSQQQHVRKHCAGVNGRLGIAKTSSLGPPYSQPLLQAGARAMRRGADPCAGRCCGSQKSLDTTFFTTAFSSPSKCICLHFVRERIFNYEQHWNMRIALTVAPPIVRRASSQPTCNISTALQLLNDWGKHWRCSTPPRQITPAATAILDSRPHSSPTISWQQSCCCCWRNDQLTTSSLQSATDGQYYSQENNPDSPNKTLNTFAFQNC